MKFLKVLGWIFVPYIMIFVSWKKLGKGLRVLGTAWALIAVLIGIGNSMSGSDEKTKPAAAPAQIESPTKESVKPSEESPEPTAKTVELSKEGESSNVKIVVGKTETKESVGDNQFSKKVATDGAVFKLIEITLTNNQKDAITIDTSSFELIDSKNREFSPSTEAQFALESSMADKKESFLFKKLNPGLSITGVVVFEVPEDAEVVSMKARGGMTGKQITLKVE